MDDGEVASPDSCGGILGLQQDDYPFPFDDYNWDFGTQICSHKHICNPTTGPDNTHTHTCEHTHTQTIGSGDEEKLTKKRRPSGNKEAVRKYREKQKAVKVNLEVRNAELEKEIQRIPELIKENARLRRKLLEQVPRQDALERLTQENNRLRSLLSHIRREIDTEMDGAGYQKPFSSAKFDRLGGGRSFPAGGVYLPPDAAQCSVPVPCFSTRPVAQAGLGDLDRSEGLGWHPECGFLNAGCHGPDSDGADVTDKCTSFRANGDTHLEAEGATLPSSSSVSHQGRLAASKLARRRGNSLEQAMNPAVAYQQGAVSCAAPVPCFNGPRVAAATQPETARSQQRNFSWQGGACELMNDISAAAEMTDDSGPSSASLGFEGVEGAWRAKDLTQSSSTLSAEDMWKTKDVAQRSTLTADDLWAKEVTQSTDTMQVILDTPTWDTSMDVRLKHPIPTNNLL